MDVYYKFTDEDINQLKVAKEALHSIKCTNVDCGKCPLYIGNCCMINHLGYIITEAKQGRGGQWF